MNIIKCHKYPKSISISPTFKPIHLFLLFFLHYFPFSKLSSGSLSFPSIFLSLLSFISLSLFPFFSLGSAKQTKNKYTKPS